MINFRYHVVSLTAVFLALAVGLVLGTAALNGTLTDNLNDQVGGLRKSNAQYRGQVQHLTAEADRKEDFDRQLAPRILSGALTDRAVLVLVLPGADEKSVTNTEQMLGYGGAKVTGEVQLTSTFTDPANSDALGDLASAKLPVDIHTRLPNNADGVESSAALLAAVLMHDKAHVSTDSRTTVLTAYSTGQNLVVGQKVSGPADAVVVVAGTPATDRDAVQRNLAGLTVVRQFAKAGPTVVAGPGTSGEGNLVAEVRGAGDLNPVVSTVDTLNVVQGRITTVLALSDQLAGHVGQYGLGDGATALIPKSG
ncbi:MAG: copper transporter [Actinocatenispora sp.]